MYTIYIFKDKNPSSPCFKEPLVYIFNVETIWLDKKKKISAGWVVNIFGPFFPEEKGWNL